MKRLSILISCMVFGFMVSIAYIPQAKALDINVPDDYVTIQEGIDSASAGDGDVVIVGVGTYVENINFLGKAITVKSTDPNDWDVVAATIIDGNQNPFKNTVTFDNEENSNSILTGLTIQNGISGIHVSASPIITNCLITENNTGITSDAVHCIISNCIISKNNGTGIYFHDRYIPPSNKRKYLPAITHCDIRENGGDGIRCFYSWPIINDCMIYKNNGFGIRCLYNSSPIITNSVIAQNAEGGIRCFDEGFYIAFVPPLMPTISICWPIITNCTIAGNLSDGGIICENATFPVITNSIIWGNYPDEQGRYFGRGNINADPLFVDPEAGDYHLRTESPCIKRGKHRCDMGVYGTYEQSLPLRMYRGYLLRRQREY